MLMILSSLMITLPNVEPFRAVEDSWTTLKPVPTIRSRLGVAVVNGKIYAIGGRNDGGYLSTNEEYDPATNTWTTKTPIPTTSSNPASATINNKIYVIGSFQSDLNQIYDPESDTWSQGVPIPTAVGLAGAGATTGLFAPKRIYVIGGYPSYDEVRLNQVYDPETDTWSSGTQMPTARHSLGVAVVNDTLYAIGGGSTNLNVRQYDENERYTPIGYIPEFPSWTPLLIMLIAVVAVIVIYRHSLHKQNQRRKNK
jgi:N-acetylneuraminic acid mutarotase